MTMTQEDTKQLLKILIGAAWIDGTVQPEEKKYLSQMAEDNGVAEDPEIKPLLYQLRPVPPNQCYKWLESYIGSHPSQEDYQKLIEALSGLIYSDGNVETEEAKLLNRLQSFDPQQEHPKSALDKILRSVRKLYRRAIDQQV